MSVLPASCVCYRTLVIHCCWALAVALVVSMGSMVHYVNRPDEFQLADEYSDQLHWSTRGHVVPKIGIQNCIHLETPYCLQENIPYTILPSRFCGRHTNSHDITMVVFTTSSLSNRWRRDLQREQDLAHGLQSLRIMRVFVLGSNQGIDGIDEDELAEEAREHGDILQGEIVESYRNLVLKTILGLQWFREACHNVDFYMKTDDDVVLSARPLLAVLQPLRATEPFLLGRCLFNRTVRRTRLHRHYLTAAQYAGDIFPPFCEGSGYIMPAGLARDVATAVYTLPVFPIEDAFIGATIVRLPYPVRIIDREDIFSLVYSPYYHKSWCHKLRAQRIVTLHCAGAKHMDRVYSCVS